MGRTRVSAVGCRDGRQISRPLAEKEVLMEALVRAAVAGTARQNSQGLATGTPLDDLVAGLPDAPAERRLLLQAGAWAAYRLAGWTAGTAPAAIPAAPPEQLRACSPAAG